MYTKVSEDEELLHDAFRQLSIQSEGLHECEYTVIVLKINLRTRIYQLAALPCHFIIYKPLIFLRRRFTSYILVIKQYTIITLASNSVFERIRHF